MNKRPRLLTEMAHVIQLHEQADDLERENGELRAMALQALTAARSMQLAVPEALCTHAAKLGVSSM